MARRAPPVKRLVEWGLRVRWRDFPENVRVMLPALGEGYPVIGEQVDIVLAPGPRVKDGQLIDMPHARTAAERSEHDG